MELKHYQMKEFADYLNLKHENLNLYKLNKCKKTK
jgi:hypothetical protein